jgi:hypothetical protein
MKGAQMLKFRLHPDDQGDSGGETGNTGDNTGGATLTEEERINAEVDKVTSPLRAKRDELLKKNRDLKSKVEETADILEGVGGREGLQKLKAMYDNLQSDEMGKLITQGKYDEWLEKKTLAMRQDHESQLKALKKSNETLEQKAVSAEGKLKRTMIDNVVREAAAEAGVAQKSVSDVILNAHTCMDFDPDRAMVVVREGEGVRMGKNGEPMSALEWIENQKEDKNWWPAPRGAGAHSNLGGEYASDNKDMPTSGFTMDEWRAERTKRKMHSGFGAGDVLGRRGN